MKHASPAALDALEPLLARLRALPGLVEKKQGIFYRGSKALLHFHEHGKDMYADVRLAAADFTRLRVCTAPERRALLEAIRAHLDAAR
jgi:hypothetical protein